MINTSIHQASNKKGLTMQNFLTASILYYWPDPEYPKKKSGSLSIFNDNSFNKEYFLYSR